MKRYDTIKSEFKASPGKWLVTGVAGFIGSNILEALLQLDQQVVGLDSFATGHRKNLEQVRGSVQPKQWSRFQFIEGDISESVVCRAACEGVDYVLHQAARGSVPLSIAEPLTFHNSNVNGFLNMLLAARDARVKGFVYASSSAVYGDEPALPAREDIIGHALSPYAATKRINEIYAEAFARAYGFASIGLRYFNVFGPRQDPEGGYAAVIPIWVSAILRREPVFINGDGESSRDFCFVENVVQANLLAATATDAAAINEVYNIGCGEQTTLNQLFALLHESLRRLDPALPTQQPQYREFRLGDVRHSYADIRKARRLLGYEPIHQIHDGIGLALEWYRRNVV
jgi:UDP-N-acetylglucosamine/UDP-N-acetylgalactosamine 4-epimerase